jgi:hypothetical protein
MDYLTLAEHGVAIVGALVMTASAICAATNTPDPSSVRGKAYRVVEVLAGLVGKAKQLGVMPADPAADRLGADIVAVVNSAVGKAAMVGIVALGLGLSACSAPQFAAAVTPAVLPADQLVQVQRVCQVAKPMLDLAADPSLPPSVTEAAIPAQAYCAQLLAGVVPPTTDSNTPHWLPQVVEGVQIAAQIAKVALPIVLPLL